jgi:hypothetical protein
MKRLMIIVPLLSILVANRASAQATCSLDCCNECFPYYFCTDSGTQYIMCSNSPHESGHPTMSFIPSCVTVSAMPAQAIWQPQTEVPDFTDTPPNRWSIYEDYLATITYYPPWDSNWDNDPYYWSYDSTAYAAGLLQWEEDSANFFAGASQIEVDLDGLDEDAQNAVETYHEYDWLGMFGPYAEQESAWVTDSTLHYTGNDVPYTQIWNQAQADTDAKYALHNWLDVCSPPVDTSLSLGECCINIVMDTSAADFDVPGSNPLSTWSSLVGGWEQSGIYTGFPTCEDTSVCPTFARYIELNISGAMLYQTTNRNEQHPDSNYILHSVPLM